MSINDTHARLRELAYQAWQDRGQPIGSPEIDWWRATELLAIELLDSGREQNKVEAPLLSDELMVIKHSLSQLTVTKPPRSRAKRKAKVAALREAAVTRDDETPLEVPPSTPSPAPPTPTQAVTYA